jgi:hypothetical protein
MKIGMNVRTKYALIRLRKWEKAILEEGNNSLTIIKNLGKDYLRATVPIRSGFLYRSIKGTVEKTARGGVARVYFDPVRTPDSQRGWQGRDPKKFPNFSLVRWAAQSIKAPRHFDRSAYELKFMDRTRDYVRSIAGSKIRSGFKRINIR